MQRLMEMQQTGDLTELAQFVPTELPSESERIENLIDAIGEQHGLERSQILLGGFSQGAMLATDVALRLAGNGPNAGLGGLVAWSGTLLAQPRWQQFVAKGQEGLNVVQSHGRLDPVLPYAGAENLREFLEKAGHQVEFLPFDGMHQIVEPAIESTAARILEMAR